jgi:hypothetical protein
MRPKWSYRRSKTKYWIKFLTIKIIKRKQKVIKTIRIKFDIKTNKKIMRDLIKKDLYKKKQLKEWEPKLN